MSSFTRIRSGFTAAPWLYIRQATAPSNIVNNSTVIIYPSYRVYLPTLIGAITLGDELKYSLIDPGSQ